MTSYKCLTLSQPFATLIALGMKKIETRSWATSFRGPLLIHAASGLGPVGGLDGLADLIKTEPFKSALGDLIRDSERPTWVTTERLPRGAIVAVCYLSVIDKTERVKGRYSNYPLTDQERAFGDYSTGRYAWLLANVRALPEPVPAKGALGLWTWDGDLPS